MDYVKVAKHEFDYVLTLSADEVQVIKILAATTDINGWDEKDDRIFIQLLRSLAI